MKMVLLCFFLLMTSSVEWLTSFDKAKEVAARDSKLVLLNFSGSDWCGPCMKMKREVFESAAFLSFAEKKLVLVRADFPRLKRNHLPREQVNHNEALAEKYNPSGKFPYTLLLDAKGNVIKEWDGYTFSEPEVFMKELNDEAG